MKRTACCVAFATLIWYAIYAVGPDIAHQALSTASIAQEPKAKKGNPDPFGEAKDLPTAQTPEPIKKTEGPPASKTNRLENADAATDANEFLEAKLRQEANLEFPDTSLQDVIDVLRARFDIPIILDRNALEDAGIGTDKTVNYQLRGFRIEKFLDLALDQLDLEWTVRDGYVLISTKERLSESGEVRVYNCSDLIEMVPATAPAPGGGGFGGGGSGSGEGKNNSNAGSGNSGLGAAGGHRGGFFAVPPDDLPKDPKELLTEVAKRQFGGFGGGLGGGGLGVAAPELVPDNASLVRVIQTTIEPYSWANTGGTGSIEAYHGGLLVVNQSGPTHRRIELLLKMMRQAKAAEPGTVFRER